MTSVLQSQHDHYAEVRRRLGVSVEVVRRPVVTIPKPVVVSPSIQADKLYSGPFSAPLNMVAPCSMRFLIAYAALAGGVSVQDIMECSRSKHIVAARHHAMALVYQHTQASLPGVGRYFKRDHTTILHALRRRGAHGKLVELTQSASSQRRAKQRKRAAAQAVKAVSPKPPRPKYPPRSEDPHTPRTQLQKAVARAYRNAVPSVVVADAYGTTTKSVKVIAHNLGLKRMNTVSKSKTEWTARGREVIN